MRVELCWHLVDPARRLVKKRARDFRVLPATPRTRCQDVAGRSRCSLRRGLPIKVSSSLSCLKTTLLSLKLQHEKKELSADARHLFHSDYFLIIAFLFIGIVTHVQSSWIRDAKIIFLFRLIAKPNLLRLWLFNILQPRWTVIVHFFIYLFHLSRLNTLFLCSKTRRTWRK